MNPSHLNVQTEQFTGTNGWMKVERIIHVPQETRLTIQVIREPVTLKFDTNIKGTVWIDSVKLSKLS